MNNKKGTGITKGKVPVVITIGSNNKITPEIVWGYFYSIIFFKVGGGMVFYMSRNLHTSTIS